MGAGLDEGANSSDEDDAAKTSDEYVALVPFRDLYKHSPVVQMAFEFGR